MKSKEFHKFVQANGWVHVRTAGSHYIYEKDGIKKSVPYHGAKEMHEGLRKKLTREMGLQ